MTPNDDTQKRKKITLNIDHNSKYSLDHIVNLLKNLSSFNSQTEYVEFLISKESINDTSLKSLLYFPFEIALTGSPKRLLLTTGTKHNSPPEENFEKKRDTSKISLHTHPISEREFPVTTPSFSDIFIANFASPKTKLVLVHLGGIIIYHNPTFNPDTKKPFNYTDDIRDLMLSYCKKRGIDIFGFRKELKSYWDLSENKQQKLAKSFLKETRMIEDETTWEDKSGLNRVLSKIFS